MQLIDKQEALKLMKLNYDDSPTDVSDLMYNDGVRSCVKAVREMKPVKGEWVRQEMPFGFIQFECSNCGEISRDSVMGKPRFRFCPMCGAFCGGDDEH